MEGFCLQNVLESPGRFVYNRLELFWGRLGFPMLLRIGWERYMKDLTLLTWLTQLGLSVAVPLGGFVWLAVWLRDSWGWGDWVIWVGLALGVYCAADGLRVSLKNLSRLAKPRKQEKPPVAFNDHD